MKISAPLILSTLLLAVVGCTTTAQTELYRAPGSVGEPYRIGGKLELDRRVSITINDHLVIQGKVPAFAETAKFPDEYDGKPVSVLLTNVRTFSSSYVRADVTIGGDQAASLTF